MSDSQTSQEEYINQTASQENNTGANLPPQTNFSNKRSNKISDLQSLDQLIFSPTASNNQSETPHAKILFFNQNGPQTTDSSPSRFSPLVDKSPDTSKDQTVSKLTGLFVKASAASTNTPDDDELYRGKEYDITFSLKRFIEFLFYHLIFFFCLGPLSFIILFPIAGVKLTKNMGFFGLNPMMINQTIQFSMVMSCVFVWFFNEKGAIDYVEVVLIIISVFQRMCTIASRYGSTHSVRIKLLKSKVLTYEELSQDYMLVRWTSQDEELLKQELYAAVKRGTVDTSLFFCRFFENDVNQTKIDSIRRRKLFKSMTLLDLVRDAADSMDIDLSTKKLKQSNGYQGIDLDDEPLEVGENVFLQTLIKDIWSKNSSFVSGISVAWDLVLTAKKYAIPRIIPIALLIGFIRSIIPLTYRAIVYGQPFGDSSAQTYVTVMSIILNTYFWGANLSFVIVGLSDMRKKSFLIQQLTTLLSNSNQSDEDVDVQKAKKTLPMLNIYDPFSLKSWTITRKLFMDFGRKFYLRINWNISGFLIYYLLLGLILGLQYFGVQISSKLNNVSLIAAFLFEIVIMGVLLLYVIVVGASINQKFREHKTILQSYRSIISDMIEFDEVYFPQIQSVGKPQSAVYKRGVEEMRSLAKKAGINPKSVKGNAAVKVYFRHLRSILEDGVRNLEIDETTLPIAFLGIELSYGLVSQMLVGLGSVGFAILQKTMNDMAITSGA